MIGGVIITITILCFVFIASSAASSTSKQTKYETFYAWFRKHGGIANGVGLSDFGDMGQGVVALKDVGENEDILKVPLRLMFSIASMSTSNDTSHVYLTKVLENDDAVIAGVMLEKVKGKDSKFEPYIAMLPSYVPSLIHFTEEELKALQDDALSKSAQRYITSKKQAFETLMSALRAPDTNSPIPMDLVSKITLEDYLWAASIVDSRGLRFRGKVYLAPYTDFFNYEPHPSFRKSEAGKFYLDHHKLSSSKLVVSADRKRASGQQIFEDYGDNDDRIYVTYHGFVPFNNPFRCWTVEAPAPFTLSDPAREFVESILFSTAPGACVGADASLGRAVEVYLTAASLSPDQMAECSVHVDRIKREGKQIGQIYELCHLGQRYSAASDLLKASKIDGFDPLLLQAEQNKVSVDILRLIRTTIANSRSVQWVTTRAEDGNLLADLNRRLQAVTDDSIELRRLLHLRLAIQYRIAMKQHHELILKYYTMSSFESSSSSSEVVTSTVTADVHTAAVGIDGTTIDIQAYIPEVTTSSDEKLKQEVQEFNDWFNTNGANPNKLAAAVVPLYRIGTLAVEDIAAEDVYLGVPDVLIMDSQKAFDDVNGIGSLIRALKEKYRNRDNFHELLFFLLQEKFVKASESFFWPYLRLLPGPNVLDIPLLWSDQQITERLLPSAILSQVVEYRARVRKTFDFLSKISLITDFFPASAFNWENYLWANAILDSRAIWWKNERHLVPMLDFVNCKEGPDPKRVHSTGQTVDKSGNLVAVTRAPWAFGKGEQVFENYGQPNHIYFMYHGFILAPEVGGNSHDCVHLQFSMTPDEVSAIVDFDTAKDIAQRVGLRNFDKHALCLARADEISDGTWFYLTVKLDEDYNEFKKRRGKPSSTVKAYFRSFIEQRIAGYHSHETTHRSSSMFLESELNILRQAHEELA